ncbi:hypothetical protein DL95DRAFT_453629 [Leptodontidium sp. 2 PMI_412]|nr:hypothetical protein DL95DRAFT_453629 [Leptodontidium sp. 2 PMI_412]
MNNPNDDFDSSDGLEDDDWDRSQFGHNPNHGKRQAASILARQAEDRILSKRNARNLTYSYGAPGTQYATARVEAAWDTFFRGLGKDLSVCPTGEEIFRFVDTMTRHIVPVIVGKQVPSLTTIQSVWYLFIKMLTFRHNNLKDNYGRREMERITVHLDQLVKRGLLVKGRWFKKQWLGFRVVEKLAHAWLGKAILQGCISWDKVLLKLLNVVLLSALAARSGDVARSHLYKGDEALCWQDIELTLSGEETEGLSVQNLRAKVNLKYLKGRKDTRNDDEDVYIDPLKHANQNVVCSIKLLMIVALRFGHVFGTTLSEVLGHTAQRADRTVQWKRPEWPVVCQVNLGVLLPVREPAPNTQANHSLKQMALAGGILGHITPHSLKRGAVRDAAYLKKTMIGVTNAAVGLVAHHHARSTTAGVTGQYVGDLQSPIYNLRAESDFVDRKSPKTASTPFALKRSSGKEIDEYMDMHGMDKTSKLKRNTAGKRLQKEQIEAWNKAENDRLRDDAADAGGMAATPAPKSKAITVPRGTGRIAILPHARQVIGTPLAEKGASAVNVSQERLATKTASPKVLLNSQAEDIPIDPVLLALDQSVDSNEQDVDEDDLGALESIVFGFDQGAEIEDSGASISDEQEPDAVDTALVECFLDEFAPAQHDQTDPLNLGPDDFVAWFSAINVFKNDSCKSSDKKTFTKYTAHGNSRNYPTRYLFHCGIGDCQYSSWDSGKFSIHQTSCQGTDKTSIEKSFRCTEGSCKRVFSTAASLETHVNAQHRFEPSPCLECPDKPNVLYNSYKELSNHKVKEHSLLDEPTKCPLRDDACTDPEKVYTSSKLLMVHLQGTHKLSTAECRKYVPYKARVTRQAVAWNCPIDPCPTPFTSKGNKELRRHLKRKHDMTEEEALEIVPLSKMEKTYREKAMKNPEGLKPKKMTAWKCPVADCESKTVLATNSRRRSHLMNGHLWTEQRALDLLPLTKRELTLLGRKTADQTDKELGAEENENEDEDIEDEDDDEDDEE